MVTDGKNIFEERRKSDRRNNTEKVADERRKNDRRVKDINAQKVKRKLNKI